MHLETVIKQVWRCTSRPRSSWTQRCTWRPWSSDFGDTLVGHDLARSGEYLEVFNRRRAGCWDSIQQLVNSQPWESDEVTLPLSSHGELAGGGRSVGRHPRIWSYILGSTCNRQNEGNRDNFRMMQYSLYVVHGVYFTWCLLTIMAWRDREGWANLVFCDDRTVVDKKERDGGWREQYGKYKCICEILGTTCLIGWGGPPIVVFTRPIGTLSCRIGDGQLTRKQNSLKCQVLTMISLVPSHLSFSCPQFYHHLRTRS